MASILKDTSLCAIVRDELQNPAGGIVDFILSTAPFVEEAIILDTGSIDGTYENLVILKEKFDNLKLYQHKFEGYATSRNRALSHVKTERALVLDADERISKTGFFFISETLKEISQDVGLDFRVKQIYSDGRAEYLSAHNPRLFTKKDKQYISPGSWHGEKLNHRGPTIAFNQTEIYQFANTPSAQNAKYSEWYKGEHPVITDRKPSNCSSFKNWKTFNPLRRELV